MTAFTMVLVGLGWGGGVFNDCPYNGAGGVEVVFNDCPYYGAGAFDAGNGGVGGG